MCIGKIAEFFLANNIVTFVEYDSAVKIFDIEKRQVTHICKPNIDVGYPYRVVPSYINNSIIIYKKAAYLVDVIKNKYKKLSHPQFNNGIALINVLEKDKQIVVQYPEFNVAVFDFALNLIYDSSICKKSEKRNMIF